MINTVSQKNDPEIMSSWYESWDSSRVVDVLLNEHSFFQVYEIIFLVEEVFFFE